MDLLNELVKQETDKIIDTIYLSFEQLGGTDNMRKVNFDIYWITKKEKIYY